MPLPTVESLTAALASHVEDAASAVGGPAASALKLVEQLVGSKVDLVPDELLADACVAVGAELYHRRKVKHGIVQLGDVDVQPVRIAKDPTAVAYPYLKPWLGLGIGA